MINLVLASLAVIALVSGSYTDFKKREVPDWISYGLILSALGIRLLYSLFTVQFSYIIYGLFGFIFMFIIANLFYFTKQWGGGDSKILMGIGVVLGLNIFELSSYLLFGLFFLLLMFVGAAYGLIYSAVLAFKNKNNFKSSFKKYFNKFKLPLYSSIIFLIIGILSIFLFSELYPAFLILALSIIFLIGIFSFIFTKSVEDSCLLKKIKASQLTEGEWVMEAIKINGKIMVPKNNFGITKRQISLLKNYKQPILIKLGIPFIPAFLIAFLAFLLVYL